MPVSHLTTPTATHWRVDPTTSTAAFRVPNFWGLVAVKGHFDRLDGWLEIDPAGQRRLELTLDAASLTTNNPMRDRHLRSADFFNAQHHPDVCFRSTTINDLGDGQHHVQGELAAAGTSVLLDLQITLTHVDGQLQIDASTTLDQRRLGMAWSPFGMTRAPTTLTVHARLRPDADPHGGATGADPAGTGTRAQDRAPA
jgi:polyisoprenoid-binding protein YceI